MSREVALLLLTVACGQPEPRVIDPPCPRFSSVPVALQLHGQVVTRSVFADGLATARMLDDDESIGDIPRELLPGAILRLDFLADTQTVFLQLGNAPLALTSSVVDAHVLQSDLIGGWKQSELRDGTSGALLLASWISQAPMLAEVELAYAPETSFCTDVCGRYQLQALVAQSGEEAEQSIGANGQASVGGYVAVNAGALVYVERPERCTDQYGLVAGYLSARGP